MTKLIFSFDDGHILDLKVADILERYGFKGIFYIPTKRMFGDQSMTPEQIRQLSDRGHEIGGHTVNHPQDIKLLSESEIYIEVNHNKDYLEGITGKKITKFCYPRGRYNDLVKSIVKDAGYLQARTTNVLAFSSLFSSFEKPTSIHLYPRVEYHGKPIFDIAKLVFDTAKQNLDGEFHLWGHSWEIDKLGLWQEFEDILKYCKENK